MKKKKQKKIKKEVDTLPSRDSKTPMHQDTFCETD